MINKVVLVYLMIVLSSCSSKFATDGEHKYLYSKNGDNIVVPAPLTSENTSHFYDLPKQEKKAVQVSIAPPSHGQEKQTT